MFQSDINMNLYTQNVESICNQYGLEKTNIIFTDNPYEWAIKRGIENVQPRDIAFSTVEFPFNRKIIVLANNISSDSANSVWSRIDYSIGFKRAGKINTPELFVKHLILHEIAHVVNKMKQPEERKADDWAAKEMGI